MYGVTFYMARLASFSPLGLSNPNRNFQNPGIDLTITKRPDDMNYTVIKYRVRRFTAPHGTTTSCSEYK